MNANPSTPEIKPLGSNEIPLRTPAPSAIQNSERQRRWRLVLGGEADESCGALTGEDIAIEQTLNALYDPEGPGGLKGPRRGGTEKSAPRVARWLGDIRKYFPASVVYSSIFGAVLASLPAVKTQLIVFDTAVVDLTEKLDDPVELLLAPNSAAAPTSTKPSATAKASSPIPPTPSSFSSPTSSKAGWKRTSSSAPTSWFKAVCNSSPCSPLAMKAHPATIKHLLRK